MPTFLEDLTANPQIPCLCSHLIAAHDVEDPHPCLDTGCGCPTFIPARADAPQVPETRLIH